jgi:hypothetical protein
MLEFGTDARDPSAFGSMFDVHMLVLTEFVLYLELHALESRSR